MGWGWRVRKTILQIIYHKGSSILTFIFLSYFYSIGISLAQSKFNWLVELDVPDYSGSCMVSSGSIPSLGTTRKSGEKLEKVTSSPSLVKKLHWNTKKKYIIEYRRVYYRLQFTGHRVPLISLSFLGECHFTQAHECSLHIYLQRLWKMLCHHKGNLACIIYYLQVGGETTFFWCHIFFKAGIDYTGCNPDGEADYLEIFQSHCLPQLARKYSSD